MQPIRTLYVINHSHTDIGFTDFQDVCFRQHAEFIEQALDLIERTADYPEGARYCWVCETTGPLLQYLKGASAPQRERFRTWHARGAIDIAGMQYNLTPLLNVEQMHRSLYPVRCLKEDYGLTVQAAMQDDVNGISWLFADLLAALGIGFLTLAVNPIRGGAPKPRPAAFWWEGPAGGKVLVWNGYHYLFGRSIAGLGDWRFVDQFLPPLLAKLEADPDYPFDFLCCEATHPMRVDNGPPDPRMPDFVRDWNAAKRVPRLEMITLREFGRRLRQGFADRLRTWRGDWTDWWCDGVASSAYETGLNRTTHEAMLSAEACGAWLTALGVGSWDSARLAQAYEAMTLYDEHTWGAFSSVAAPNALFSKSQWNRKAAFAYTASLECHDVLARSSVSLADLCSTAGPEGVFNMGNLAPEKAYPSSAASELLVINPLPWDRRAFVEEPEIRGNAAPAGILDCFFPRGIPWGGNRPQPSPRRIVGHVPGMGFAFLPLSSGVPEEDLNTGTHLIENAHYRVRVHPKTGAVMEWLDKELNFDFAGTYRGWQIGQYVYERVDSTAGREAIFEMDFSLEDFGTWSTDTPFRQAVADRVEVDPPVIENGRASIEVRIQAPGIRWGRCRFWLDSGVKALGVDWLVDKEHCTDPEAVFIAFPFRLGAPRFRLDLNGVPCTPNDDQLPGTVRDWYPIQRWVDVSDGERGVTVAPLDAPLVQLGGITTGRWMSDLKPEGPTVMSWAMNNHWMVNFKASQGGEIPLRYRLTTHAGLVNDSQADCFSREASTPLVVLRDRIRTGEPSGRLLEVPENMPVRCTLKPAEDGQGVIVRLHNLGTSDESVPLRFVAVAPHSANLTNPVEVDGLPLAIKDGLASVPVAPRQVQSVRVRFR
ncbi:MAG: glycosyl hydrolase-related protein [Acidobacteriota bacterium]